MRSHGGRAPRGLVDFSTPLNPLGPPPILHSILREALEKRVYAVYPDYEYRGLREAIASYYGLDPSLVTPLNGAAEALALIPLALRPERLIVVEPTFGDHLLHSTALGIPLIRVAMVEGLGSYRFDPSPLYSMPRRLLHKSIVIVSNPNNPTGACTPRRLLLELLGELPRDSLVVLDESFAETSLCREELLGVEDERLVVIRSLTKSLGVPGLRVGFAYAPPRVARMLDAARQAWNVNSLAAYAVERLYSAHVDELEEHLSRARSLLAEQLPRLSEELRRLGLHVYESTAPLILFRGSVPHPRLLRLLASRGVWVRDASSYHPLTPYHTRVAVKTERLNQVLLEALRWALGGGA